MNVSVHTGVVPASGAAAELWHGRSERRRAVSNSLFLALIGVLVPLIIASTPTSAEAREPGQPRGCPSRWCGCYLAHYFGMPDRKDLWRARAWATVGKPTRPKVGAIVVWRNHVGVIVGKTRAGWIVKSGNDGNRVRVRVRPVHTAIAFRQMK